MECVRKFGIYMYIPLQVFSIQEHVVSLFMVHDWCPVFYAVFLHGWKERLWRCHPRWFHNLPPPPPRSLTLRPWKVTVPIEKDRLPTTIFQGQAVKLRGGIINWLLKSVGFLSSTMFWGSFWGICPSKWIVWVGNIMTPANWAPTSSQ